VSLDQNEIRRDVERRIEDMKFLFDISTVPPSGRCLYYAVATIQAIKAAGLRAILQAGTAMWPMIRPEQDDGVRMTHFSYVWSPDEPKSREAVANGKMPEMHVWAAIPALHEIVDFSTGFWPGQALVLGGFDWPGDRPPEYLWCKAKELPSGVIYQPNTTATMLALLYVTRLWGGKVAPNHLS